MIDRALSSSIIDALAILVIGSQILLALLVIVWLIHKVQPKDKSFTKIYNFISDNSLPFAFLIAVIATCGSLFLSEIAGFTPCKLCWFQRIFMYPETIILGIATFLSDNGIRKYVLPLVVLGFIIATYHYILQMSPLPLPCTDEVASCAAKQAARFGYITIPLMSWTAFALIGILMVFKKK